MRTIGREDLQELREKQGEEMVLVNVLPKEEFDKEHIPGSRHVPVGRDGFTSDVEQLAGGKDGKTVVVYCASPSCDASAKAARRLEEAGFTDVVDYEGGMSDWKSGGLTVAGAS